MWHYNQSTATWYVKTLKENDLSTDVYFSDVVPVLPPNLRPIMENDGALIQSPLNRLYSNLILYNSKYKDIKYKPKTLDGRVNANIYGQLKSLYLSDELPQLITNTFIFIFLLHSVARVQPLQQRNR